MAREQTTCWQRGLAQPLTMTVGSSINFLGGVASLILSAQNRTINPLPFICTAMLTSSFYIVGNAYRSYQIINEKPAEPEQELLSHVERIERERETRGSVEIV